MNRPSLEIATVDQLVGLFIELCIAQDQEMLRENISKVNRLYDRIELVKEELKRRPGDQRKELIKLYQHPNMHVRLKAATATLAVVPQAARAQLEEIRAANWQPQSLDAGMCLRNLDAGIFQPT